MTVSDEFSPEEQKRRLNALLKAAINTPKPTRKLTRAEMKALPHIHEMPTEEMERIADVKAETRAETGELKRLTQPEAEERELARLRARRTQLLLKYGGSPKNLTEAERKALENFQGPVKVARNPRNVADAARRERREQRQLERMERNQAKTAAANERARRKQAVNDALEYVIQVGFTVAEAAEKTGCSESALRTRIELLRSEGADLGLYQEAKSRSRQNGQFRSYRDTDRPRGLFKTRKLKP